MQVQSVEVRYRYQNSTHKVCLSGQSDSHTDHGLKLELVSEKHPDGSLLRLTATPERPLHILSVKAQISTDKDFQAMLVNGIQSWSQSREMGRRDRMLSLNPVIKKLYRLQYYGDYYLKRYNRRRGCFHSYFFTYFRKPGSSLFIGSLDETTGHTIFNGDLGAGTVIIEKDCTGLFLEKTADLFKLFYNRSLEPDIGPWSGRLPCTRPDAPSVTGWTSWYNYYTGITEEIILDNIKSLKEQKIPIDFFQIDDGYQRALGDWLIPNEKFPQGMGFISQKAHEAGFKPGIWLAPFCCDSHSHVFRDHPDWLLRDGKGRLVNIGLNTYWKSYFYALDIYHPGVRDYLKKVFSTILYEWNYELVKLDFLYAAAVVPRPDKTRGRVMDDAMAFLHECVGGKLILGCGVPLAAAWGKVNYCRIGSDVALMWEDRTLEAIHYRERVSTRNSLYSTVARFPLDGRAFRNDPDVVIVRDENTTMNSGEKHTLLLLNALLGSLVFFSDHVGRYTPAERRRLDSLYPRKKPDVVSVQDNGGCITARVRFMHRDCLVLANMTDRTASFDTPGAWFGGGRVRLGSVDLDPHCSMFLHPIPSTVTGVYPAGTEGHIFPLAELKAFTEVSAGVDITLEEQYHGGGALYFAVSAGTESITVNGQILPTYNDAGYTLARYRF